MEKTGKKEIITNERAIHPFMEAITLQHTLDYIKLGRWLRANPSKHDEKGKYIQRYNICVKDFEGAKSFFESDWFLSFVGGNKDARQNLINNMNKILDLPDKLGVEEAIYDLISNKKKAEEVVKDPRKIKRFLDYLRTEGQITIADKTNAIKVDQYYLNFRGKMLVNEIAMTFIF